MYYQRSTEGITRVIILEDKDTSAIIWYGSCKDFSNLNIKMKDNMEIQNVILRTEDIQEYTEYEKEVKIQKGLEIIITLAKMKVLRNKAGDLIKGDIVTHERKEELCGMV